MICADFGPLVAKSVTMLPNCISQAVSYALLPELIKAIKIVGKCIAEFVIFIKKHKTVKIYKDMHLIGSSLGVPISGVVGFHIKQGPNRNWQNNRPRPGGLAKLLYA